MTPRPKTRKGAWRHDHGKLGYGYYGFGLSGWRRWRRWREAADAAGRAGRGGPADVLAGLADAGADQAQPGRGDRLQRPAGDVPAPVHVRVRRRDRGLAEGVLAVRAAGHHRAELAVHDAEHGDR